MKSVAIWVLRYLLIPAGFLWAAGFFNLLKVAFDEKVPVDSWSSFSEEEMCTLEITLVNFREYGDSLLEVRKKMIQEAGLYDPYLYFRDFKQYRMFEVKYKDSFKEDRWEGRTYMRKYGFIIDNDRDALVALRDQNWRRVDWDNLPKYSAVERTPMTIQEAQYHWFPVFAKEDARAQNRSLTEIFSKVGSALLSWLFRFYLKGFPVAFILFLLWRVRLKSDTRHEYWGKEDRKPVFESSFAPLSFLLSLIFWPVILARHIKDGLDNNMRKAEILSRRKEILSLLSKQDKELYALSQKMSLREFRVHLDALGLKRKHSFGVALLVVFFFATAVRISAQATCPLSEKCIVSNIVIDHDVGSTYFLSYDMHGRAILPEFGLNQKIPKKTKNIFSILKVRVVKGFTRLIDGVPKGMNQFAF